jgi:hypothetical protein
MSPLPSSVHAVVIGAGIHGLGPGWHLGLDSGTLSRAEMAGYATRARTLGVNYIGSCCGPAGVRPKSADAPRFATGAHHS